MEQIVFTYTVARTTYDSYHGQENCKDASDVGKTKCGVC